MFFFFAKVALIFKDEAQHRFDFTASLNKGDFFYCLVLRNVVGRSGAGSPQGGLMVISPSRGIPFTIKIVCRKLEYSFKESI